MHRITFISLISLVLAVGCASDGEDMTGPAPGVSLTGVSLEIDHGVPLDRIAVTGIEGEAWEFEVDLVDADGTVRSGAPVVEGVGDTLEFPVPFHPDDPAEGGLTQIRVRKGQAESELIEFTIDPLPVANGGMGNLLDRMRSNLELRAGLLGTSVSELASSSWAALDPIHVPLKATWALLDDPDNENRLSELAAGRAPILGEGTLDVELLDRVIDLVGASSFLSAENQFLNGLGTPPQKRTTVDIGSAEQLDWYMSLARSSASRLEPGSAVNQFNSDLGLAMSAVGIVPHPAAQLTAAGVGAVQYAYNTARQAMANLLPSTFQSMDFELSHEFFNEDSEATGQWSKVDVWAVSEGWNADQAMVDGLLVLASFGRAHTDWMNRFESITGTAWATNVRNFILDNVLRMLNAVGQNGVLEFPPETYGPIDITGMPWSKGVVLTDKILITTDLNYQPNAIGEDQLEVRTAEDKFGGADFRLAKPVEVRRIMVEVTPALVQLEDAGDVVTIQATIHNADNEGLEWEIGPATWEIPPDGVGTGTEIGSIRTPGDPNLYNFVVSAVSTSNTGLRAGANDGRGGSSEIRLENRAVVVDPAYECIGNDQTLPFSADVLGLGDQSVTWTIAEGWGDINAEGVYRAPSVGSGDATIVATSVADPDVSGWATVTFGACQCWWEASIAGAAIWNCGGDGSGFLRTEIDAEFANLTFFFINPEGPGGESKEQGIVFSLQFVGPGSYPFVGDLGTYRISGSFVGPTRSFFAGQIDEDEDDPGPVLTMTVTENTSTVMAGTVQGQMVFEDQNEVRSYVTVNAGFRAGPALSPSSCYD